MMKTTLGLALLTIVAPSCARVAEATSNALHPHDHIAILGGGFADRMQHDGTLEALLHKTFPQHDLVFRNLACTGDAIEERMRIEGFGSPDEWLKLVQADVVWACFGWNESFAGEKGLAAFKGQLHQFVHLTLAANYSSKGPPRLVLFSPIAAERGVDPDWADPARRNADLALYTAAMAEVAKATDVPFVDLFAVSQQLFAATRQPLTVNGIHLSDAGYEALAPAMYQALIGTAPPAIDATVANIRTAVRERNAMWFDRYRTVDGYNVYGGRSHLEFDGLTNRTVLQEEMAVRDAMTEKADRVVWAAAQGKAATPDDSVLPPVTEVKTNKLDATPYLGGEAAIAKMTAPKGVQINLFASEEQFPELVNPVQMAWDTRGRLWVSAWATYPERTPWDQQGDRLLILEDADGDGKAERCTTFLDQLNSPTGFQFVRGGIVLMQAPDLWFVAIDPVTGLGGARHRLLGGLNSADTHHQTNSMCLDPGGATYLSDGVFHRSQIETRDGLVRNIDAAIFRYEPRTHRFERYIAYGFANPHGRVFDSWGNDFVTDATGNENYFGPAFSGRLDGAGNKHKGLKHFWDNPSRPCAGTALLSSTAWPAEYEGSFLNLNVIGFQGIFRARISEDGSGLKGESVEHFLASSDPNFRPTAANVGPDGAVYVADWSNAIIGHMQHHIRDPVRDHGHGRLYRLTYEGKTSPRPAISGQPIAALLELLKAPTNDTRERAKIELGERDTAKVMAELDRWVAALDAKDPDCEHHRTEALWVKQWHNMVDPVLLGRVLRSPDHRARAAATRVLCYQRERVGDAMALLAIQATDAHPRVRLEAVRAASYFEDWQAADVALQVCKQPMDYYLSYTLGETIRQLTPWWKRAIAEGKPLAADNRQGIEFLLDGVPTDDLARLPPSEPVWQAMFARADAPLVMRQAALQALAKARNAAPLLTLLALMEPLAAKGGKALADAASLLLLQPAADLAAGRDAFARLATADSPPALRQTILAALMIADGSPDLQWAAASGSPAALIDLLEALTLVPDAPLRAAAAARVLPLLGDLPVELGNKLDAQRVTLGRFVRVQLPRKGTLTLAEVEVLSDGKNIATNGTARQSSTSHGGDAQRAIDGKQNGAYDDHASTHSKENENQPWWEVDLGAPFRIDEVAIWNRTDAELGKRLDGFTVAVLDADRRELLRTAPTPAPKTSVRLPIGRDPRGALRRAAIRAAIATDADPKAIFAGLAGLLANGEQVSAAALALKQLPRDAWKAELAGQACSGIVNWAKAIPIANRTADDVVEVIGVGNSLADQLAEAEAKVARAALRDVSVTVLTLKTVRERMVYDQRRLVVEAGRPFQIVLINEDMMPHNLVVVAPGARQEVALAAQVLAVDKPDAQGRVFVPVSDKILGATKLVNPGQREALLLTAPVEEGEYEYVCTFPSHWTIMWGTLIVTRDPAAWLASHPQRAGG